MRGMPWSHRHHVPTGGWRRSEGEKGSTAPTHGFTASRELDGSKVTMKREVADPHHCEHCQRVADVVVLHMHKKGEVHTHAKRS
jgi:hypothetical protein